MLKVSEPADRLRKTTIGELKLRKKAARATIKQIQEQRAQLTKEGWQEILDIDDGNYSACLRVIEHLDHATLRDMAIEAVVNNNPQQRIRLANTFLPDAIVDLDRRKVDAHRHLQQLAFTINSLKQDEKPDILPLGYKDVPEQESDKVSKKRKAGQEGKQRAAKRMSLPEGVTPAVVVKQVPFEAMVEKTPEAVETRRAQVVQALQKAGESAAAVAKEVNDRLDKQELVIAKHSTDPNDEKVRHAMNFVPEWFPMPDEQFQAQPSWKTGRGTSGFKGVSYDGTKTKPWRVKVGQQTVHRYSTKAEACEGYYQWMNYGHVWDVHS